MDCGFDSARLGAITVIAHTVRQPDNRLHYLEVSGVPVHPASQSRPRQNGLTYRVEPEVDLSQRVQT